MSELLNKIRNKFNGPQFAATTLTLTGNDWAEIIRALELAEVVSREGVASRSLVKRLAAQQGIFGTLSDRVGESLSASREADRQESLNNSSQTD